MQSTAPALSQAGLVARKRRFGESRAVECVTFCALPYTAYPSLEVCNQNKTGEMRAAPPTFPVKVLPKLY